MTEKQSEALIQIAHILVDRLRLMEQRFAALQAFVISTSPMPSVVEDVLALGVSKLRTLDPSEEQFRQLDALLELSRAGKKLDEMDG